MSRLARCLLLFSLAVCLSSGSLSAQDNRRYFDPELILEPGGRTGSCDALQFTADGESLLAVGDDRVVRSWPVSEGRLDVKRTKVLRWMIHREQRGALYAMALSPDPKQTRVVVAGNGVVDMTLVVLDRANGDVIHAWRPKARHVKSLGQQGAELYYPVRALAYSPNGKQIAVGTDNGSVFVWTPAEVEMRARTGASFTRPLPSVQCDRDGVVRFLGRHENKEEFNRIRLLHFEDDNSLLSISQDGKTRRWTLDGKGGARGEEVFAFLRDPKNPKLKSSLNCVTISRDGKWIAAGHELQRSPEVELLDVRKLTSSRLVVAKEDDLIYSLAFSPDTKKLAVGMRVVPTKRPFYAVSTGKVVLCEVGGRNDENLPTFTTSRSPDVLSYHPSGKYLAVAGGDDHEVTVWDVSKKQASEAGRAASAGHGLWAVSLSRDGASLGFKHLRDPDASNINHQAKGEWRVFDLKTCRWSDPARFEKAPRIESQDTLAGWRVQTDVNPTKWKVVDPKGNSRIIPLDPGRVMFPTCYTFFNSNKEVRLAIGHLYGVSVYELKVGKTPRFMRMYSGHAGDVTSICAHEKSGVLLTASTDQTIAAWRLSDWPARSEEGIPSELGASFEVKEDKEKVERLYVKQVDPGSPAWEAGLLAGEEIVGCFIGVDRYEYLAKGYEPREKVLKPLDVRKFLEHLENAEPNVDHEFRVYRGKGKDRKIVQLSTTARQRPMWMFFPTRENEWVLWRWRDFYYHCSTRGDDYVGWQLSRLPEEKPNFFRAEQFRKKFHNPEKVKQIVWDEKTNSIPDKVNVPDMQPPEVSVTADTLEPKEGQNVVAEVVIKQRSNPDAVDPFVSQPSRVVLWVNEYVVDDVDVKLEDRKEGRDTEYRKKITIPYGILREGDNPVIVQAYNQAGNRENDNSRVTIKRYKKAGNKPGDQALMGIMVGVSQYQLPALKLDYASKDARKVHDAWGKLRPGKIYTDVAAPVMLLDKKATGETVKKELEALQKRVANRPDATVVIFLSGHGSHVQDTEGRPQPLKWQFLCHDYADNEDKTVLEGDYLYKILTKMPCRKVILMDCCHAGINADAVRALTPAGIGPVILSSCQATEEAFEAKSYDGGLFTYALLEGISRFDKTEKDFLSADDVQLYVSNRVPQLIAKVNKEISEARRRDGKAEPFFFAQTPVFYAGREHERHRPLIPRP